MHINKTKFSNIVISLIVSFVIYSSPSYSACVDPTDIGSTTCAGDGTMYAGQYDGRDCYVTPNDESSKLRWDPLDNVTGATNTSQGRYGSPDNYELTKTSTYPAQYACAQKNAASYLGHNDWYLPSANLGEFSEMNFLWNNRVALGMEAGFVEAGDGGYWSSTEVDKDVAQWCLTFNFMGGLFSCGEATKNLNQYVRCMRCEGLSSGGIMPSKGYITTNTNKITGVSSIVTAAFTETKPEDTEIYYLVTFDGGITWKYYKTVGGWQTATVTTLKDYNFSESNASTSDDLILGLPVYDFEANGDSAFGFAADLQTTHETNVPSIDKIEIIYL